MKSRLALVGTLLAGSLAAASLLAACGSVRALTDANDHGGDAPGSATAIDAPVDARTAIRVTALGADGTRAPSAGIPIVFTNDDGSVASQATSAVDGTATGELPRGGSVSAVWLASANRYVIETVRGVRPGDDLAMIGADSDRTQVGQYNVTWPALAGVGTFYVYAGCGPSFAEPDVTSGLATIYAYCKRDTITVAVAAFAPNGQLMGYLEQRGVAYVNGGHTALAGPWQSPTAFNASITDISTSIEAFGIVDRYTTDGLGVDTSASAGNSGTTLSLSAPAATTADGAWVQTTVDEAGVVNDVEQSFAQPIAGNSFMYRLDVGANLLPWVDVPALDSATTTITVPRTGGGAPDAAIVTVIYSRSIANVLTTFEWIVIGADVDQPITLPALPSTVGPVAPVAGDNFDTGESSTILFETDAIGGYDQIRGDVFGALLDAESGRSPATLVRVSSAAAGGG